MTVTQWKITKRLRWDPSWFAIVREQNGRLMWSLNCFEWAHRGMDFAEFKARLKAEGYTGKVDATYDAPEEIYEASAREEAEPEVRAKKKKRISKKNIAGQLDQMGEARLV